GGAVQPFGEGDDLVVVRIDLTLQLGGLPALVVDGAGAGQRGECGSRRNGRGREDDRDPGPEVHMGTPKGSLACRCRSLLNTVLSNCAPSKNNAPQTVAPKHH